MTSWKRGHRGGGAGARLACWGGDDGARADRGRNPQPGHDQHRRAGGFAALRPLLNDKQEPDGYDVDVAKLLGSYLGVKVNLVTLTSPNRIPFLVTNKVDLIVATFGITPERAKQVMFSIPVQRDRENVVFAAKGTSR